ncbi:Biosynthetic Aromatic amino acid aminotransferase beta [hydrothermal vent metagenome]|uniref:Biosynthetic Aromatic amino acid aminotransferase beta n=1 Tax=hydrothermal vent metagenome TaxID=652676 RepID=A0A3B0XSE3_9ZZZZ
MDDKKSILFSCANQGIQSLKPYLPGKPVAELERELGLSHIIKLASNENPMGAAESVMQAIRDQLGELTRYPDGNAFELKQAIADRHSLSTDCITIGNGSNDILELIARVFLKPGDNAIFSQHAFAVYPIATQAAGGESNIVPANSFEHTMPHGHDLDGFLKAINDKTRIIFVANPNNPTGTWLSRKQLYDFIKAVPDNIVVVIDEAYFDYVIEADYPDSSVWLAEFANLLVTRTFSKAYGLAALRVGYGLASEVLTDLMNRVRQPFNVNFIAQIAALAALKNQDYIDQSVALNQVGYDHIVATISDLGYRWIPSVGNFICIDAGITGSELFPALLKQGIIVRPIDNYELPQYIRVTIGTAAENERFLTALKNIVQISGP